MSDDKKNRCGGWEEPCDKPATRSFHARVKANEWHGAGEWHTNRLCDQHYRAFVEKNDREGFAEIADEMNDLTPANKPNCNCLSYEICPTCDPEFFKDKL